MSEGEVNEYEICREYRTAKRKDAQIGILADLNLITRKEVREILVRNGLIDEKKVPAKINYTPELIDFIGKLDKLKFPPHKIAEFMKMSKGQISYVLRMIRYGKQPNRRR